MGGVLKTVARALASVLLAVTLVAIPAYARPAVAKVATAIDVQLERPVWRLKERMVVTGKLTAGGVPLGNVPVRVGVNGYLDESPYQGTTAADGTYRFEFWVEDWWGFGGNTLTAQYRGDDQHEASDATTIFQVTPDQVKPVTLTVDPVPPDPVVPGQHVTVTGTLRNDRNEPAEGHSIIAVIDAATDARSFANVDDQGRWTLDVVVPTTPGDWSEHFPTYRVPIVFEGDWWLAPAQQEIVLTLARAPGTPAPTPSASPTPALSPSPTPSATPGTPSPTAASATPAPEVRPASWWPAWLPGWVASPAFLITAGGALALLLGITLVSHARRG